MMMRSGYEGIQLNRRKIVEKEIRFYIKEKEKR